MNYKNCSICGNKLTFSKKFNKPQKKKKNLFNFSPKKISQTFMNAKNVYIFIIFTSFQKKIVNIYKKNYNLNSHQNIEEKFKKNF